MNNIIIIGAGATGLMAAKILSSKGLNISVLEARDRPGGRIHTIETPFSFNCEAGAEFIHGKLKLTAKLLKEAGLKQTKVKGGICKLVHGQVKEENDFVEGWGIVIKRLKKLKTDITISRFLEEYITEPQYAGIKDSLKKYVQGYDAADITDASAFFIREEMENEDDDQFRICNGYSGLINFLFEETRKKGGLVETSTIVKQINWQKNNVEVITSHKIYNAQKVIITVPVGVLQANENEEGYIKFYPGINKHRKAIGGMGFGGAIKILLEFDEAFWFTEKFLKTWKVDKPFFIFGDTFIPAWWTQFPDEKPLLTGWLAGPEALKNSTLSDAKLLDKAISSLAEMFSITPLQLNKRLKAHKIFNWVVDPFCLGGYSYASTTTANAVKILKEPVMDTLYFAGEALAKDSTGTVDAALQSGKEVAERILKGR